MILDNSIKVKNYKCFGDEEQGFEKIFPINIIIGRNNSRHVQSGTNANLKIYCIQYIVNLVNADIGRSI